MNIVFNNFPELTLSSLSISNWLHNCIHKSGYSVGKIMYNFVDAETMYSLNNQYLNHKTHTDIITFDYSDQHTISAEVFISEQLMHENAKEFGQSVEKELLRLLCHAPLHCLGFVDKTEEEKEEMRLKENEWIDLFHVKH